MRFVIVAVLTLLFGRALAAESSDPLPENGPNGWRAVYAPYPDYPRSARAAHLTGHGVFLLRLKADGSVESVEVVQSTGHAILDRSCVATYGRWRFHAGFAQRHNKVKIPVTFTMTGIAR